MGLGFVRSRKPTLTSGRPSRNASPLLAAVKSGQGALSALSYGPTEPRVILPKTYSGMTSNCFFPFFHGLAQGGAHAATAAYRSPSCRW